MSARTNSGDTYALCVDPRFQPTDEEKRLATNCIVRPALSAPGIPKRLRREPQPDADLLLVMLNLAEPDVTAHVMEQQALGPEACEKHGTIYRVVLRKTGRKVRYCIDCRRDYERRYQQRLQARTGQEVTA